MPLLCVLISLIQTLRHPDVKRVEGSAKDVEKAHQEMMITYEARRLARARSGPFDLALSVSPFLFERLAKPSHERGRWPSRMAVHDESEVRQKISLTYTSHLTGISLNYSNLYRRL